jgi:formylglycine-generating enzyme required for sulfatase activity
MCGPTTPAALSAILAAALTLSGCGRHPPAGLSAAPAPRAACLTGLKPPQPAPATDGMILIRGGVFQMGAKPLRREEGPARWTRVGAFWIDRTDVTNGEFARFVKATGYVTQAERPLDPKAYPALSGNQLKPSAIVFVGADAPPGADPSQWWRVVPGADWRHPEGPGSTIVGKDALPVVQVSWADAIAYAHWLGRDLPTEAEWEYAAQGGKGPGRFVWGDQPFDDAHPQANVWQGVFPRLDTGADGYKAQVSPVGCFPANGYGLYDMAGDVWQWTRDWYRPNLDPGSKDDPKGPEADAAVDPGDPGERRHVIKGGSFLCSPDYCFRYRPAAREAGPTDTGENHIGFRTVLRIADQRRFTRG